MTQASNKTNRIKTKSENMRRGDSACLQCGEHLAYCGQPFTANLECPKCGAVNIYEESQQPKALREYRKD
jgi:hypothetical protein